MWIERNHKQKIINAIETRPVVLLTGIRQVGKSSLLQHLLPNTEYVTLDKVHLAEEAETNPTSFLNRFDGQVIVDEVQYAPSLFRELKVIVDENRSEKGKWILTGSQQFSLMQQVSESLAGRVRILNLGTLSVSELNNSGLLTEPRDLLWKGGFPELWTTPIEVSDFFDDYIQTYLERDLRQVLQVTNLRDFRRFLTLLALRVGQLLNFSELAKDTGVAVNTIKSWVHALETSGMVVLLPPFYNNLGKRLVKAPKVYFSDNGLVAALLNIGSLSALEKSPLLGSIWENFVLTEYLKEAFVPGKNLFFYRDQNGVEMDFVIEKEGKVFLVEAKSNERPNPKKLNFRKVAPLFKEEVVCVLACGIREKGITKLSDYSVYNPLFNFCL